MPDAAGSRLVSGHPPTAPASRPPLQSSAWAKASAVVIRPAPGGPTNAYACATRSVASARRSSATARGWSRIASSATQELLDARAHRRGDHVRGLPRAHEAHALGLRAQDLEVAPTHAPMEGERLALEAVAPPAAHPPVPLGAQPACEAPHLGRLARPLDPLERDEHSVHVQTLRVPQYATLARGPAPIVVARAPEATPRSWRRRRAGPAPRWPGPTPGPCPGGHAHPSSEPRPCKEPRGSARSPAGRRSCGTAHRGSS